MEKNPYKNNDYLRKDENDIKEMLFFQKFQIPMEEQPKENDEEKDREE